MLESGNSDSMNAKEQLVGRDLHVVVEELIDEIFSKGAKQVMEQPREYRVSKVDMQGLEDMATIPFEVTLARYPEGITLLTGSWSSAVPRYKTGRGYRMQDGNAYIRLLRESVWMLHTHPNDSDISPEDFKSSANSHCEVEFMLNRRGIAAYKTTDEKRDAYMARAQDGPNPYKGFFARLRARDHHTNYQLRTGVIDAWLPLRRGGQLQDIVDYMNGDKKWANIKEKIRE